MRDYSIGDVKKILQGVRDKARPLAFFYKNDNIPPKVIFLGDLLTILDEIESKLEGI